MYKKFEYVNLKKNKKIKWIKAYCISTSRGGECRFNMRGDKSNLGFARERRVLFSKLIGQQLMTRFRKHKKVPVS